MLDLNFAPNFDLHLYEHSYHLITHNTHINVPSFALVLCMEYIYMGVVGKQVSNRGKETMVGNREICWQLCPALPGGWTWAPIFKCNVCMRPETSDK